MAAPAVKAAILLLREEAPVERTTPSRWKNESVEARSNHRHELPSGSVEPLFRGIERLCYQIFALLDQAAAEGIAVA